MSRHARLALAALTLGLLAALAGQPRPAGISPALVEAIAQGEGRLSVVELARWIKSRRADLTLLDLQADEDFGAFHIPTAERVELAELERTGLDPARTIVLYGGAGPIPAQAWLLLRAKGFGRVYYLERGVSDWLEAIEHPVLPDEATEAELAAWPEIGELSRYFGGLPRRGGPRPTEGTPAWLDDPTGGRSAERAMVEKARRRGCGF
ncbi:MAG: rhodanese-like domain-containing protein [Gemmatimonadales bacterium]